MRSVRRWGFRSVLCALAVAMLAQACTTKEVLVVVIGTVSVSPGSLILTEGQTQQLIATVRDDQGTSLGAAVVVWSSSDGSILSVTADGVVEALGRGSATIRAEFQGVFGEAAVVVNAAPQISVDPTSLVFLGAAGDPPPPGQAISVTNGGGGNVTSLMVGVQYGSGGQTPWLEANLIGQTTPTVVTVSTLTAGLPVGQYSATIELSSPDDRNSPLHVPVSLSLTGLVIVESGGSTQVDETGSMDDFTVALASQPTEDVVLSVTSGDEGEATVAPTTLTFTSGDWDSPQGVTVTGVDDLVDDGDRTTPVSVAVVDELSDDAFDPMLDQIVSVVTLDDDGAGFLITESDGSTEVSETGTTDDFTVVLTAAPLANVVFDLISLDPGEVTVDPTTLTFTPGDWDTPQPVTVTGVDDAMIDDTQTTQIVVAVNDVASDDAFDDVPDRLVTVMNADDDGAGFSVVESGGSSVVNESGTMDDFTVVLNAEPASAVVMNLTSENLAEVTVAPATLTFTPGDWDQPQTATLTGVDDAGIDGSVVTNVTVAVDDPLSDDAFDGLVEVVLVTTTDNDGAGFSFADASDLSVSETGTTDGFTVVLDAEPSSDVVLTVTSLDPDEVSAAPPTVTLTTGNWNVPQPITLTGVDDDFDDGDQVGAVEVAVDPAASDDDFDAVLPQSASVITVDDDTAGLSLLPTPGVGGTTTVDEAGTLQDTLMVVLDARPVVDVVVAVSSGDTGEATVAPSQVTFTTNNWSVPQPVTVTGVDDAIDDDDKVTVVTASVVNGSSDDAFDGLSATANVTTLDDDGAGFMLANHSDLIVSEAGLADDFTVVLTTQPLSAVVIRVVADDPSEVTVLNPTATFLTGNWDQEQTINLVGANDNVIDGSVVSTVTLSIDDGLSDPAYHSVGNQSVSVTTLDNDNPGFQIDHTGGNTTVSETGTQDAITVVLTAQPDIGLDVIFDVSSANPLEATVAPTQLTFTNGNWNMAQNVTVTGVDDEVDDGDQVTLVTVAVNDAQSPDPWDPLADQSLSVTTQDDDDAGITVTPTSGLTTTEGGGSDTFEIVLTSRPSESVSIMMTSTDPGEGTVTSTNPIVFSTGNWKNPRTVTVTGVDDAIDDGDVLYTIVTEPAVSGDLAYDGQNADNVTVTNTDDDAAMVTLSVDKPSLAENGSQNPATVTATLSHASVLPVTVNLAFTGSATNATDYTRSGTQIVIPPLSTTGTVTISAVDDSGTPEVETNETVVVDIVTVVNATENGVQQTTVTIVDDDAAAVTVENVTVTEGSGMLFTVTLDNTVVGGFTVDVTLGGGTATGGAAPLVAPEDYDNVVATLNFTGTAGQSRQFTVATLNDAVLEATETFTVSLDASHASVTDTDQATGTINDNDNAAVTVENVTVTEGSGMLFTVTLDNAVQGAFTVNATLAGGTATGGAAPLVTPEDYNNVVAPLNFTGVAGQTRQFTVTTLDDAVLEATETFTVSLVASNALVTDSDQATGTINDNDAAAVTVENVTVTEGSGMLFTVTLDNAVQGAFTVTVTLAGGTATGGAAPLVTPEDYDNVVAPLNFTGTAGQTRQFTVATLDDDLAFEGPETFTVSLVSSNALVTDSDQATGTISDNDLSATLTVGDVTVTEGAGMLFTVTLDKGVASGAFTVDVTFADVTATGGPQPFQAGDDYDNAMVVLNFAGTAGEMQQFTVDTHEDLVHEPAPGETFTVNLSASNGSITDSDTATGTINDDDPAPSVSLSLNKSDLDEDESDNPARVTATLSAASSQEVTVNLDVISTGTLTADYTLSGTQIVIPASSTSGFIDVFAVDDAGSPLVESDETVTVSILNAVNATPAGSQQTVTIHDDDVAAVTVENVDVTEGAGLLFTVTLDNPVQDGLTVDVTLSDVTATGGSTPPPLSPPEDYDRDVATLNFAGTGGEMQQFAVATLDDDVLEASETFTVSLDASHAAVTDSDQATGTINDNDDAAVTVENVTETEGSGLEFTVTLDNAVQGAFTVNVALTDVSATGGPALVTGVDYVDVVTPLNFTGTAGQTRQFTVATWDDALAFEGSETFTVSLTSSNALVTDSDGATGTIDDANTSATLTVGDVTVTEGTGMLFTVTLDNGVATGAFTVDVTLSGGTAVGGAQPFDPGEDYDDVVGTLNFAGTPGEMQQFTVATWDDALAFEGAETFDVSLSASNGSITDSDTAIGTINDAQAGATLTVGDVTVTEGTGMLFTVTLDNGVATGAFTVDVTFADVTATGGSPMGVGDDYDNAMVVLNFAGTVGEMQQFTVDTQDDLLALEGSETFTVSLSASNGSITDSDTATGTIDDND